MPWGVVGAAASIVAAKHHAREQERARLWAERYRDGSFKLGNDPIAFAEWLKIQAALLALPVPRLAREDSWWPWLPVCLLIWIGGRLYV